jgi:seryl-tRNA synthetase
MLQLQTLRDQKDKVLAGLKKRNFQELNLVDEILLLDEQKRKAQTDAERNKSELNVIAKEVGNLMKLGKKAEADSMKEKSISLKESQKGFEDKAGALEQQLQDLLVRIPNIPHESVPQGKTPEENINEYQHGEMPQLYPGAIPHWELASKYDIIDFELGNKVTGAGFPFYKGKGARLQRALINFFLDEALKAGYYEIQPPIVINKQSGFGTGQLPDKEGQMYYIGIDEFYLIPTAEVPITNIYRDTILKEEDFPIKNVGYTPCFRREAGSYGAHVRGLNRLHQFDKVEIVQITKPEDSYQVLDTMVEHVKGLLEKLELPYRILRLCGGDMGFNSALTFDFEVFSAAQQKWLEVSSTSNFEAYQANRMKCRYKNKEGKNILVHTLNGSALALPRIVAALLENNQTENGIRIPEVLRAYCGFELIN